MNTNKFVMDTAGTAFFADQLKWVAQQTYDRVYPELLARTMFPVASNFAPWASDVAFRSMSRTGTAKIAADAAIDVPVVDIDMAELSYPARSVPMGFNYSDLELIRAQREGTRLDEKRAFAARQAIEEEFNLIAFHGDDDAGLPGLFNNSDIGSGDAATGKWQTTATAAQIMADLTLLWTRYVAQNNGRERPNALALPPKAYARAAITPVNTYTTQTILDWLTKGGIPGVSQVYNCPDCASVSGMSSHDVAVLYTRDPMKLELKIPAEIKIFSPQAKGLGYHVPMYGRISGLHIFYPKSIYVLKGLEE